MSLYGEGKNKKKFMRNTKEIILGTWSHGKTEGKIVQQKLGHEKVKCHGIKKVKM